MGHHNHDIDISEKFEFTGRERMTLLGLMALGLICLGITYFQGSSEDHHLRFWTNLLHNTVFFTGIAFVSMFLLAAKVLSNEIKINALKHPLDKIIVTGDFNDTPTDPSIKYLQRIFFAQKMWY